ncbi:MAG: GNAT family N-acetyltransferase [Paracoccaceae bacterium]
MPGAGPPPAPLPRRPLAGPPARRSGAAPSWAAARAAIERAVARGARTLNEAEAKEVLIAAGVPTVRTRRVGADPAEARAAAEALAADGVRRFALKILSDDLVHKSDAGGVMLDIEGAPAVEAAAGRMLAEVRERAPGARLCGLSVQEMLRKPDAHELICGLSDDPVFGPAVLFGRGGTAVEVVNDKALGLPPLDMALADDLIGATRVSRKMAGYRRHPAADRAAVAAVLVRLSEIARALPMITELDINPLLADEHGAVALDARITVSHGRMTIPAPNPRFAIHPYPDELVGEIALKDGARVPCRPVRPEDADLYARFFEGIDPEDLRLRFFSTIRKVPPATIASLTQIDYARAMAFVALDPGDGSIIGSARLVADASLERAEYAVQVRSDQKGRGLGRALMRRLVEHAERVGIREIWGEVLRENRAMLGLNTALGFEREVDHEEGIVHVRLAVAKAAERAA